MNLIPMLAGLLAQRDPDDVDPLPEVVVVKPAPPPAAKYDRSQLRLLLPSELWPLVNNSEPDFKGDIVWGHWCAHCNAVALTALASGLSHDNPNDPMVSKLLAAARGELEIAAAFAALRRNTEATAYAIN